MVRDFFGVAGVTFPRVVIRCIDDVPPNPALFDDERDNTLRCFCRWPSPSAVGG